jgi:hypothetical protein
MVSGWTTDEGREEVLCFDIASESSIQTARPDSLFSGANKHEFSFKCTSKLKKYVKTGK